MIKPVDVFCPHCGGKQAYFSISGSQFFDGFYLDSCECTYCHKLFYKYLGSATTAMWFDSLRNLYLFKSVDEAKEHHERIKVLYSLE